MGGAEVMSWGRIACLEIHDGNVAARVLAMSICLTGDHWPE
jgi:hypothetical protein